MIDKPPSSYLLDRFLLAQINASFQIEIDHLHKLGVLDATSYKSMEIYESGKLSSNERLYFSLWACQDLNSVAFEAKKKILQKGDPITSAYFIVSGTLITVDGDHIEHLGPGAVIGLAEGIKGLPYPKTLISACAVQARVLPLSKIVHLKSKLPTVMQKILNNMVERSLT